MLVNKINNNGCKPAALTLVSCPLQVPLGATSGSKWLDLDPSGTPKLCYWFLVAPWTALLSVCSSCSCFFSLLQQNPLCYGSILLCGFPFWNSALLVLWQQHCQPWPQNRSVIRLKLLGKLSSRSISCWGCFVCFPNGHTC